MQIRLFFAIHILLIWDEVVKSTVVAALNGETLRV
jgi:hypothetical protein